MVKSSKNIIRHPLIINIVRLCLKYFQNILLHHLLCLCLQFNRPYLQPNTWTHISSLLHVAWSSKYNRLVYWCVVHDVKCSAPVAIWIMFIQRFPHLASDWLAAQPQAYKRHIRKSLLDYMASNNSEALGKQRTSNILDTSYMKNVTSLVCYAKLNKARLVSLLLDATV